MNELIKSNKWINQSIDNTTITFLNTTVTRFNVI
jgi:hypothetical protein